MFPNGKIKFVGFLQIHPEVWRHAKKRARRSAVSAVISRLPATICEMRLGTTLIAVARAERLIVQRLKLLTKMTPGWIGVRLFFSFLMVIFNPHVFWPITSVNWVAHSRSFGLLVARVL
jgi:hypothetical protein